MEHRNGVIRHYYVEITRVNTSSSYEYSTEYQYILINNLQPDVIYTFRISAYTVGMGPFSERSTIILNNNNDGG